MQVFPEWLITVCIVWLLSKTSIRTFTKGMIMWKDEGAADTKRISDIVSYWRLLPHESKFKEFQVVALAYLKWKAYKRPALDLKLKVSNPQESELSSVCCVSDMLHHALVTGGLLLAMDLPCLLVLLVGRSPPLWIPKTTTAAVTMKTSR